MTAFSFHPVKHITTGEGGMVTTNNKEYYGRLKLFKTHGITKNIDTNLSSPWYYEMRELGYNYRMEAKGCHIADTPNLSSLISCPQGMTGIFNDY
ncbi:hypothetical protein ES708_18067 [subsurface metagenome]